MTWGRTYLWIAILIFAAAASVVARLVEIGEANPIDGRNPISFCNLLFAGNLVAALTLFALYHREWHPTRLRTLSRRQWLIQTALALTSGAIAPAMMFTAIAHTSVTNIVLIETIEIPLGLLLAWLLYREKSNWTAVLGALCALGGVATGLATAELDGRVIHVQQALHGLTEGQARLRIDPARILLYRDGWLLADAAH